MRALLELISNLWKKAPSGPPASHFLLQTDSSPQVSSVRLNQLKELEERLNYSFSNPGVLDRALTHKSFLHESQALRRADGPAASYEALEFLGDSILGFLMSEILFITYPQLPEGDLSKMKSFLVSTRQLSHLSEELGLGSFLRLSHGEEKTGGRQKKAILADLFESLTAAIYLDGGLQEARQFVIRCFAASMTELAAGRLRVKDSKSSLQEKVHELGLPEPRYRVVEETGPDHRKTFLMEVEVRGELVARASGRSKKEAEQKAAQIAVEKLVEESKVDPASLSADPDNH